MAGAVRSYERVMLPVEEANERRSRAFGRAGCVSNARTMQCEVGTHPKQREGHDHLVSLGGVQVESARCATSSIMPAR